MNVIAHHRVGGGQNLKHHGNTEGIRGHKGEKAKSTENLPKLFNKKKTPNNTIYYTRDGEHARCSRKYFFIILNDEICKISKCDLG